MKNPNSKVPRTVSLHPAHLRAITTWVDQTGAVRPFPVAHPGEIVGELVEHAQATGFRPSALRKGKPGPTFDSGTRAPIPQGRR